MVSTEKQNFVTFELHAEHVSTFQPSIPHAVRADFSEDLEKLSADPNGNAVFLCVFHKLEERSFKTTTAFRWKRSHGKMAVGFADVVNTET